MDAAGNIDTTPDVLGRHLALDDQGVGLRATWRPARGFINVSLWRDDRCTETFHLTPGDAAELMGFLARSLASGVAAPTGPTLHAVPDIAAPTSRRRERLASLVRGRSRARMRR
ncbi:MAG: hypothetical protein ACXIVQ_05495 [Acidimicrobiales bacterium]